MFGLDMFIIQAVIELITLVAIIVLTLVVWRSKAPAGSPKNLRVQIPKIQVPEFKVPKINIPEIKLPDINIPEIHVPAAEVNVQNIDALPGPPTERIKKDDDRFTERYMKPNGEFNFYEITDHETNLVYLVAVAPDGQSVSPTILYKVK